MIETRISAEIIRRAVLAGELEEGSGKDCVEDISEFVSLENRRRTDQRYIGVWYCLRLDALCHQ